MEPDARTDPPVPGEVHGTHDLVAHLYGMALQLMREHGQAFLPLEVVRERLGWAPELMGQVADRCVATAPVVNDALVADWMAEGDRPAFGTSRVQFIGIREVPS